MNKLYAFCASALLAMGGVNSSALADDVEDAIFNENTITFDDWTIWSGEGHSGSTWLSWSNSVPSPAKYACSIWSTTTATQKNEWLSSPAITFDASKSYALSLDYQTWNPFQLPNFEIYLADAPVQNEDAETLAALTTIYSVTDLPGVKNEWLPLTVNDIKGSGQKYLVFHVSGKCVGRFSIANALIYPAEPASPSPNSPTDLAVVADPDGALEATLTWTLPTENTDGEALTGDYAITSVNIYRDDEKIQMVEGAVTTFLDTEATGLTAGKHSYAISVIANEKESALTEPVTVDWVGPWSYLEPTLSVSNDTPETSWSFSQNSSSANIRSNSGNPGNGFTNSVQLWASDSIEDYNAWISSPTLNIIKGRQYKISFYYRFYPGSKAEIGSLSAYLSDERAAAEANGAAEAKGLKLLEVAAEAGSIPNNAPWEKVEYKGYTATESPLYLNLNVNGKVCMGLYISGLTIEEYEEKPFAPQAPTELKAEAAANQELEVTLTWKNPTLSTDGDEFTADQVVEQVYIYRDDFETPAFSVEGNVETATDNAESGLTAGAHTYKIKVVVADKESDFSNEASVLYVGPMEAQALPWEMTLTGLSNENFKLMWTAFNAIPGQTSTWNNKPAGIFYMNSSNSTTDCWLVGNAPLEVDDSKAYLINYHITTNASGFTPDVEIGFVDSLSPTQFVASEKMTFGEDASASVSLASAPQQMRTRAEGDYYLAVHDATVDPTDGYNLVLSSVGVKVDPTVGINEITSADDASAIYDLAGNRIASDKNLSKGVYIIKNNGKVSKIMK